MVTEQHRFDLAPVTSPVYEWKDHSRFVEIYPVSSGWLVLWGRYEAMGAVRTLKGQRIYASGDSVRRRMAWEIIGFTKNPVDARDALRLLDRQGGLPSHRPRPQES